VCLPSTSNAEQTNLELVLAVDASGSMNRTELLVQRRGYVAALRSAEVAAAIEAYGSVALAYVEWAGPRSQHIVVPWSVLSDAEKAAQFAEALAAAPIRPAFAEPAWETGTSIAHALLFAAGMFSAEGGAARIIDISGDGPDNSGALAAAREHVITEGITINGLPVITQGGGSDLSLSEYYEDCVIGGPGAFAMVVDDLSRFEIAIRRKLVLEIAGPPARLIQADYRAADDSTTDCGY